MLLAYSETRDWIEGDRDVQMPDFLNGRQAVVWARNYSAENEERCDCDMLQHALSMVPGAQRMVSGQRGTELPTAGFI